MNQWGGAKVNCGIETSGTQLIFQSSKANVEILGGYLVVR